MNVLIIDDDKRICKLIKSLLDKYYSTEFEIINSASSINEGLKSIESHDYDLLLLDIHLGKNTTSFDLLKKIKKNKAKIIFITGHENYAIEAIKSGALDYILKPIQTKEFRQAIDKSIKEIRKDNQNKNASQFITKQDNSLMLKDLERIRLVKLNEIVYLAAGGAYTDVFLDTSEKITVTKHLKDFENKLDGTGFYRVHNSYIINTLKMSGITKKDGLSVNMVTGENIVISSRRKDEFLNFIETYLEI